MLQIASMVSVNGAMCSNIFLLIVVICNILFDEMCDKQHYEPLCCVIQRVVKENVAMCNKCINMILCIVVFAAAVRLGCVAVCNELDAEGCMLQHIAVLYVAKSNI